MASPRLSFTALDIETANSQRGSICAVALVKVRDGHIIDHFESYVRPFPFIVAPINQRIHGISIEVVENAPEWAVILPELVAFIGDDYVVAHNASFDKSGIRNACWDRGIPAPDLRFICTMRATSKFEKLEGYSLKKVSTAFGFDAFEHHNALADAERCALIALKLAERHDISTIEGLGRADRDLYIASRAAKDYTNVEKLGDLLKGLNICFTGALDITREQAKTLVASFGGIPQGAVSGKTDILVVGDFDSVFFAPGAEHSSKMQKALDLKQQGKPIEILTENEFFERLASLGIESGQNAF